VSEADDPRCPECGEPIGMTATYCMHCSADLTDEQAAADSDGDDAWDGAEPASAGTTADDATAVDGASADTAADGTGEAQSSATIAGTDSAGTGGTLDASTVSETLGGSDDQILDPDGIVDNALTVGVGIVGGIVIGFVGTIVLAVLTGSAWAILFGLLVWLGSTAYLVRHRTVQGAVAKTGYAIAAVLLAIPLIALTPAMDGGGLVDRGMTFVGLLLFFVIPAGIVAAVGWVASQFVPEKSGEQ
jgi:hypothetical protein